ncbi:MAG: hypothetical protein K6G60_04865 [Lachnospiraceae bacterium]|nr:hypothetical protein [Lachnospiraceae bacterium]
MILFKTERELRHKKVVGTVYIVLRVLVIASLIIQAIRGRYENVALCVLTLILFMLPTVVEDAFKVDFPDIFEIIVMVFIFAAEILGEINSFYTRIPGWDTALHTVNGFMCAAIGFAIVDLFNRNKRISVQLSPLYLAITSFCFSMTIGVIWEFFEFGMDMFLGFDMQKDFVVNAINSVSLDAEGLNRVVKIKDIKDVILVSSDGTQTSMGLGGYLDIGIIDTMKDLLVNFVGAVFFSIIGAVYVRNRDKKAGKIASQFIPKVMEDGVSPNEKAEQPSEEKEQEEIKE